MQEEISNELNNSYLVITKDNDLITKDYTWINGNKVIVGVTNEQKSEIVLNEETGLNYRRYVVEGKEIYNRPKRVLHGMWFLLDLETGSRGWFPGCEIHGDIYGENIKVYKEPADTSEILETITRSTVIILDLDAVDDEPFTPGWYKIKYNNTGFVKMSEVFNIRYEMPFVI